MSSIHSGVERAECLVSKREALSSSAFLLFLSGEARSLV